MEKKNQSKTKSSSSSSTSNYYLQETYQDEDSYYNGKLEALPCRQIKGDERGDEEITSHPENLSSDNSSIITLKQSIMNIDNWKVTGERTRGSAVEAATVVKKTMKSEAAAVVKKTMKSDTTASNLAAEAPTVVKKKMRKSETIPSDLVSKATAAIVKKMSNSETTASHIAYDIVKTGANMKLKFVLKKYYPKVNDELKDTTMNDEKYTVGSTVVEMQEVKADEKSVEDDDPKVVKAADEKCTSSVVDEVATRMSKSEKERVYPCTICGKEYKTGQALGGHKSSHTARVKVKREGVTAAAAEARVKRDDVTAAATTGLKNKENKSMIAHECEVCNKRFDTITALKMHRWSHDDDEDAQVVSRMGKQSLDLNHEPNEDIIYI